MATRLCKCDLIVPRMINLSACQQADNLHVRASLIRRLNMLFVASKLHFSLCIAVHLACNLIAFAVKVSDHGCSLCVVCSFSDKPF